MTATTLEGCISKDTTFVAVNKKPTVTLTDDATICESTSIPLMASGGATYKWSPVQGLSSANIPNPIASPITSTKYFVTVTDSKACINIDSVEILVRSSIVFEKPEDKVICEGDTVHLVSNEDYQHIWSPVTFLSSATVASPIAYPTSTMTYSLSITDPVCQTDSSFLVRVTVNPKPELTLTKSNDIDCAKQTSQLTVSGAQEYIWQPSLWLNDARSASPVTIAQTTTTYKVIGTNSYGCINIDSISVQVKFEGVLGLYIPTAFTPNNDGKNDCFSIKKWQAEGNIELSVFTRWGELIFHTTDPMKCWDGTFKGKELPGGVYVYMVKGNTSCGEIFKKGTFALIR